MVVRTHPFYLALLVALAIPLVASAAGPPPPRRGPSMPVGRDLLQEALARRGLSRSTTRVVPNGQRRLAVSSNYSSCGVWSYVNFGGVGFLPYAPVMVYDSARDRMLIFGTNLNGPNELQVWALTLGTTPSLTQLETVGLTSYVPYQSFAAIYDPVHDRVVVCGGYSSFGGSSDYMSVFELTLTDPPTWNDITPDGDNPGYRAYPTAIYDASRGRLVMFGGVGFSDSGDQNSVWALDLSGTPAWTHMTPTGTAPGPRDSHTAVYDAAGDRMVVFAGSDNTGNYFNDTWALSLGGAGAWSQLAPSGSLPAARWGHTAVVDVPRSRMLVFSGFDAQGNPLTDLWRLSLSGAPKWTQINPTGTVSTPRYGSGSVYDPVRQQMLTAIGDEVWSLGNLGGTPAWSELNPTGQVPLPRYGAVTIYDAPRQRLVMFGGGSWAHSDGFPSQDLWTLSLLDSTWTRIIASGTPAPARGYASAIFDPTGNRMILFGGAGDPVPVGGSPTALNDTWQLTLSGTPTWTHLNPGGTDPPVRYAHTAILDAPHNRMIIYGGDDGTQNVLSDAWALSLSGGTTWSQLSPTGSPAPPLEFHTAVFDAARDRMLMFGGNDANVWALGMAGTPSWSTVTAAGTPPSVVMGHQAAYDAVRDRMLVSQPDGSGSNYALTLSGTPTWGQVGSPDPVLGGGGSSAYDTGRDRWLTVSDYNEVDALSFPPINALNLLVSPADGGSVNSSPSGQCQAAGSQVEITATPAPYYGFTGWSGDASGNTNPLTVTMNANKTITANFGTYSLTTGVSPAAGGTVTRNPDQPSYAPGSQVTLTAVPAAGYGFTGWSGNASGTTNPITVTMNAAQNITANFTTYPLATAVAPTGSGTITRNPNQPTYAPGSQVSLTAVPAAGYAFTGWSGDASGTTNPITVTMDAAHSVTANFTTYALTTAVAPTGSGTITRNPNQSSYTPGSQVTLTAAPATGYGFTGWSGDTSGTTNPITVPMNRPKTITANFTGFPVTTHVSPAGTGTVTKNPNQAVYAPGSQVVLTASNSPYPFMGWSGDATGSTNPLTVTVDGPKDITANILAYTVTVSATPASSGNVIRSPSQSYYAPGAQVTLTATPAEGYAFTGWSGDTSSTVNPLALTVYANRNIVANFGIPPPGCGTWSLIGSDTIPSLRGGTSAVWDPLRHRIVVFGGYSPTGGLGFLNEVWALTAAGGWTRLAPTGTGPSGRNVAGMVYEPGGDRLIIVGGNNASGFQNDAWQLSLAGTPTWSALAPTGTPPSPRFESSAIYDPVRNRVLVFGGQEAGTNHQMNDVWALNLSGTPSWALLAPGGAPPGGRHAHVAVYDPLRDRMLMVGGVNSGGIVLNDLWALPLSGTPAWSQLGVPVGTIPQRFDAQAIYDPVRDRMLLVGGRNSSSPAYGDVWSISLKVQPMVRQLGLGGVLGVRYFFSAVYEPETDLLVAIDGLQSGTSNDYRSDSRRLDCAGGWWLEDGGDYGTVAASPLKTCYGDGEVVTLTPSSASGHAFLQWLGDLSGNQTPADITMDGNKTIVAQFTQYTVGVEDTPKVFALEAIHPNPNRGPVEMAFALPVDSPVRLSVYDIAGRVVADVVDGLTPAGRHVAVWNGKAGATLRAGIYVARLETPAGTWTRRIVLIH